MIVNMHNELRDFVYITNVYKCISNYNLKGHKIGRKIGDMLEILTMGAIYRKPELLKCLSMERGLDGYTTAGHKVEFGFFQNPQTKQGLFGAIECKCVGVEETVAGKNNKNLRNVSQRESFKIDFAAQWLPNPIEVVCNLVKIKREEEVKLELQIYVNSVVQMTRIFEVSPGENFKIVIDENNLCQIISPNGNMLKEVPAIIRICRKIELQKITQTEAVFAIYNCLTGPQTIEKAKQASLVAMDLRKRVDGYWGKEEIPAGQKKMSFVHVLCEYSHWDEKSRNVIKTCIDHNVVVPDAIIIKAFEVFEKEFGLNEMLNKISKTVFKEELEVREAVYSILDYFESHVFYDIELNKYVEFNYQNGFLTVVPIT